VDEPGGLLFQAILKDRDPVLFIEHKLLYSQPLQDYSMLTEWDLIRWPALPASDSVQQGEQEPYPVYILKVRGAPRATVTIAAYGYMAELARRAALRLAYDYELFTELVIMTQLAPFELTALIESVSNTKNLITVEEGSFSMGWGAEILARTVETIGSGLESVVRLAALDLPIPASKVLENTVLPDEQQIIETCLKLSRFNKKSS